MPRTDQGDGALASTPKFWGYAENVPREGRPGPFGWGRVNSVGEIAQGVVHVDCEGHGGLKLSPERNRAIPPPLRRPSGWYEEDCESHIVGMAFPEAFGGSGAEVEAFREAETQSVKDWFPDDFEKAYGVRLGLGESYTRDEQSWKAAAKDRGLKLAVNATVRPDMPGVVLVAATDDGEAAGGGECHYLVPDEHFQHGARHKYGRASVGAAVPDSAVEYTHVKPVCPPDPASHANRPPVTDVPDHRSAALSPTARDRIFRDLRSPVAGGDQASVGERIARGEYSGKTAVTQNGKTAYFLSHTGSSLVTPVSKATWDAYQGPDERTPAEKLRQDADRADAAYQRWQTGWRDDASEGERLRARRDQANTAHRAAQEAARQADAPRQAAMQAARTEAARQTEANLYRAYQAMTARTPGRPA